MAAQQHRQEGVRTRLRAQPGSSRGAQEGLRVEHFMLSGALATAFVSPGEWAEGQSQREAGGGGVILGGAEKQELGVARGFGSPGS